MKYIHGARIVSAIMQLHLTSYALIGFCVPNNLPRKSSDP